MKNVKNTPTKQYLKDYQRPSFEVDNIELYFNILEHKTIVINKATYLKTHKNSDLILNGVDLELKTVKLNNQIIYPEKNSEQLIIKNPPEKFLLEIETETDPSKNTALEGLYLSNGIYCTQCEAESFRRITYFLDRPDVMTKYSVCIEADQAKYPVLLSNGDRIKAETLGNGRHRVYWSDPYKKPSYLFALVAGNLGVITDTFTTKSGKKVSLEIYASPGKQNLCEFAMEALKKSMQWDEEVYGLEYDLSNYMIVAIDDFNAGAMENKGLNIFNSRLVFANPTTATDLEYHNIESVIAHEYFHNWTGNRVTLRDWFQLSLKEGLTVFRDQEFSSDMHDRGVQRIQDVESLRSRQFPEDAGPNAHPVRPDSCYSVDNFFTATIYEKGAEVIRMMENFVGKIGFNQGMRVYFERHDGQAVTTEDFAKAIFETNHFDYQQFLLWYEQAGTPEIEIKENYSHNNKVYTLNLNQNCSPSPNQQHKKPFQIPIIFGLLNSHGEEIHLEQTPSGVLKNSDDKTLINLNANQLTVQFVDMPEKPILSALRGFSAPVNLKFEQPAEELYFLIKNDRDLFNKKEALQKVYLNLMDGFFKGATQLPSNFLNVYESLLESQNLASNLKANLFQLPDSELMTHYFEKFKPLEFYQAEQWLNSQLAKHFEQKMLSEYERLNKFELSGFSHSNAGHRALKNTLLKILNTLKQDDHLDLIYKQYHNATNMTDNLAALTLLADTDNKFSKKALDDFYQKWNSDPLVLNKWFAVQAIASTENTLETIKELVKHPKFNIKNPNNVYSLLRNFGENNHLRFHKPDMSSYQFFLDKIVEIDAANPQVAARLCAAFNPVLKLENSIKDQALNLIKTAVNSSTLSKNTYELLSSYT